MLRFDESYLETFVSLLYFSYNIVSDVNVNTCYPATIVTVLFCKMNLLNEIYRLLPDALNSSLTLNFDKFFYWLPEKRS